MGSVAGFSDWENYSSEAEVLVQDVTVDVPERPSMVSIRLRKSTNLAGVRCHYNYADRPRHLPRWFTVGVLGSYRGSPLFRWTSGNALTSS